MVPSCVSASAGVRSVARSVPAPPENRSVPVPPVRVSLPRPPQSRSSPGAAGQGVVAVLPEEDVRAGGAGQDVVTVPTGLHDDRHAAGGGAVRHGDGGDRGTGPTGHG